MESASQVELLEKHVMKKQRASLLGTEHMHLVIIGNNRVWLLTRHCHAGPVGPGYLG
jgi:hypothetical protein